MFTLIRSIPLSQVLFRQIPALSISFIMAEMFYKFHSFTLECLAFLGTWFVVDVIFHFVTRFVEVLPKRLQTPLN